MLSFASTAGAQTESFDGPIVTGPTQAPRSLVYGSQGSGELHFRVTYGGRDGTLEVGIDGDDYQGPANFYNTQGRKFDVGPDINSVIIDLYVDSSYADAADGTRLAGFWGSTVGGPDDPAYPIIELYKSGSDLTFRGWDNTGNWFNLGTLGAGDLGTWQTLRMDIDGSDFLYNAGGATGTTSAFGTTSFSNVILQAHNAGLDYNVHWDNLNTAAVPEPASWAMMISGFGLVGGAMRRRSSGNLAAA
ncbi:MAG: PEPxxWA-CTERM sorting domain-containing protein [Candidatus Moraniibacteriota bacterium]